jgi:RimJ/RimL family protein N-acetyltransferase
VAVPGDPVLRDTTEADVPVLFEHQLDATANRMAAFTARDPSDRAAFFAHWGRLLADDAVIKKTIEIDGAIAGHLLSFQQAGRRSVGYWIAKDLWGHGIATRALALMLAGIEERPLFARAAADNAASIRVLQKCGFRVIGSDSGYSYARGRDVPEVVLELAPAADVK